MFPHRNPLGAKCLRVTLIAAGLPLLFAGWGCNRNTKEDEANKKRWEAFVKEDAGIQKKAQEAYRMRQEQLAAKRKKEKAPSGAAAPSSSSASTP